MESISSGKHEVVLDILHQIRESIEKLMMMLPFSLSTISETKVNKKSPPCEVTFFVMTTTFPPLSPTFLLKPHKIQYFIYINVGYLNPFMYFCTRNRGEIRFQ